MTSTDPLLELGGLTVEYQRGRRQPPLVAVDHADLAITTGETLALVGESGSGKSTLGNAVLGLVPATRGTIRFAGEDITRATVRRRRALTRDIQGIFQDPYGSLNPRRTIGQTLAERLLTHDESGTPPRQIIAEALARVGLDPDAADRYPAQFSGGQRQRIAIARALIVQPRLVVCDEPTSALDLSVQAQVLNLLKRLQRELRLSYLFITHDFAVVRHVAHRVAVLYRGAILESGPTEQICTRPAHTYTQRLLDSVPVPDPVEQRKKREQRGAGSANPPPMTAQPVIEHELDFRDFRLAKHGE
jgi:ABC-type oligopeptide transport system ATPase subunit